jgi:hypothetical protein
VMDVVPPLYCMSFVADYVAALVLSNGVKRPLYV